MKNDTLTLRILKILLAVLATALALAALAAVAALLFYGLVLAAVALVLLLILSPEDLKAFLRTAAGRIDGWIGRLEGLWASVKSGLDAWGEREMAARAKTSGEEASGAEAVPGVPADAKPDASEERSA